MLIRSRQTVLWRNIVKLDCAPLCPAVFAPFGVHVEMPSPSTAGNS